MIRLWLESVGAGFIKIPYGSYVTLENGVPAEIGVLPHPELTPELCRALLRAAGTPERVIRHCEAVACIARGLAERLGMDAHSVECAALLHDIARTQPNHPETGADWLVELDCPEIADMVRLHHDHSGERLDEAAVVYLADKLVIGDAPCTLAERFAASAVKCTTPEAVKKHDERRAAAENIARLMEERGVEI